MKTQYLFALTVVSLMCFLPDSHAQGTSGARSLARQERAADVSSTVELARSMTDVNYTDVYDRSLLMYAASKGYARACRILLRRGADNV